ncbi:hypothetical protein [Dactylosporangium darangshiense]|uniref:Uncharacterized protein n=1 Tax=Dactylosporangium darangshiense TaxID=579108 RepID=A0ABP8DWV2_9ACTN
MLEAELSQATATLYLAAIATAISAVGLYLLLHQIRLLRTQVNDAKDGYMGEQLLSRQQSTLEFLASTLEARTEYIKAVPSLKNTQAVSDFLEEVRSNAGTEKTLIAFLSCYENLLPLALI